MAYLYNELRKRLSCYGFVAALYVSTKAFVFGYQKAVKIAALSAEHTNPKATGLPPSPHPPKNHLLTPLVWGLEAAPANTDSHLTLGARIVFPLEPCIFNHHRTFHTYTNTHIQINKQQRCGSLK